MKCRLAISSSLLLVVALASTASGVGEENAVEVRSVSGSLYLISQATRSLDDRCQESQTIELELSDLLDGLHGKSSCQWGTPPATASCGAVLDVEYSPNRVQLSTTGFGEAWAAGDVDAFSRHITMWNSTIASDQDLIARVRWWVYADGLGVGYARLRGPDNTQWFANEVTSYIHPQEAGGTVVVPMTAGQAWTIYLVTDHQASQWSENDDSGFQVGTGIAEVTIDVVDPAEHSDLNLDGAVNGADLALVLVAWGNCHGCPADLNFDGSVNGADLARILTDWTG
ncbi:MAG: hypothetical protein MK085_04630 [Phycisphaerales bacterium]|nr:hypothetical protein [Phycisphaerales bacterium]